MFERAELEVMDSLLKEAELEVPIQAGSWQADRSPSVSGYQLMLVLNGHTICVMNVVPKTSEEGVTKSVLKAWLMPGADEAFFMERPFEDHLTMIRHTLWDTARNLVEGLQTRMGDDVGLVHRND